jgi:Trk K+ transport system NAD-binding subunit
MRGKEVIIPTGSDTLEAGDDAVVFSIGSVVDEVERLFSR